MGFFVASNVAGCARFMWRRKPLNILKALPQPSALQETAPCAGEPSSGVDCAVSLLSICTGGDDVVPLWLHTWHVNFTSDMLETTVFRYNDDFGPLKN
ncbi:hypothetical protein M514_00189 [Trichuris suis]|uniref:Uncharacterized protein n=1 Tax=Trichuris suis TaxID=68888 RepID=A0A085NUB5_9BILA|nr:hypothetical protein M513_00189 [Trichuris suis]KFD73061.1 hypothetical protein M514_00189 [Trichuris suis]